MLKIIKILKNRLNNYILIKKYPFLECRNVWTNKKVKHHYDYTWLDDLPIGWRKFFGINICKDIKNLFTFTNNGSFLYQYRIVQIKEKYGFLHWYDNGVPSEISDKMSDIIKRYEEISKNTCIVCGHKGYIDYNTYWLTPLCEKHKNKF